MSEPTPIEVIRVKPSELLFDPNSFRLVRNRLLPKVPDEFIEDPGVQADTLMLFLTQSDRELEVLADNMRRVGWVDTLPMIVRRLSSGKLVLLDGNRRLAALRRVAARQHVLSSESVSVMVEREPESARASLELALRNASPSTRWFEVSQLLWTIEHSEKHTAVPELPIRRGSFGVSSSHAEVVEVLKRCALRHPSIVATVVFEEIANRIKRAGPLDWLKDVDGGFDRSLLDAFADWVSAEDDDDRSVHAQIRRSFKIPDIAGWLREEAVRDQVRSGVSLREIVARFERPEPIQLTSYLHPFVEAHLDLGGELDVGLAQSALNSLREIVEKAGEVSVESGSIAPWDYLYSDQPVGLQELNIKAFRGLENVRFEGLRRLNILVGINNVGKTSVLEAISILTRLADPRGLLDSLRVRTRSDPERDPGWLARLLKGLPLDLEATVFDRGLLSTIFEQIDAPPGADVATFIDGFRLTARHDDVEYVTETLLYSNRPRSTRFASGTRNWLTRSVLHSPYAVVDSKVRSDWYEQSMDLGSRQVILNAIQEAIDPDIVDIRLGADDQSKHRFFVDHRRHKSMDLAMYGEGIQRIFELGNLFAAHKNGIVLIDEIETAIHVRALKRFSLLIQQLAEKFQVQVFATTHSKEAVDAFLMNDYRTEDIAAFTLRRDEKNELAVRRFDGPTLRRGVELVDVDIRRL